MHSEERLLSAFGEMADGLFSSQCSGSWSQFLEILSLKSLPHLLSTRFGNLLRLMCLFGHTVHTARWVFHSKPGDCHGTITVFCDEVQDFSIHGPLFFYFLLLLLCSLLHFAFLSEVNLKKASLSLSLSHTHTHTQIYSLSSFQIYYTVLSPKTYLFCFFMISINSQSPWF